MFELVTPAAAQNRFQVPDGCGTEAEFRNEIERLTGSGARSDVPSSLSIEALDAEPGGYELRVVVGNDDVRVLRDPDCRILFRSAIVIAAAAPGEEPPPVPAPPAPTPPAEPTPTVPLPAAPAPASAPPTLPPSSPTPATPAARTAAPPPIRPPARRRSATTPRERQYARLARSRFARSAARADTTASRSSESLTPSIPAPSTRLDPAGAELTPAEPPPPELEQSRLARPEPARRDPSSGRLHLGADLGLGVSGGMLPDLGATFELGAQLQGSSWGAAISLRYWPERSGGREGRSVQVSALGGQIAALLRATPALNVVAGLELNRLSGERAEDVPGQNSAAAWQFGPNLGARLVAWDIQYLRLEFGVGGRISVLRPRFVVTGFGDLYRVPVLGADAIIRGVWLFR